MSTWITVVVIDPLVVVVELEDCCVVVVEDIDVVEEMILDVVLELELIVLEGWQEDWT